MLYEEDFVCLIGRAQRTHARRFTLKQYLDLPHAIVETWEGSTLLSLCPEGWPRSWRRLRTFGLWIHRARLEVCPISWPGIHDSLRNQRTHGFANKFALLLARYSRSFVTLRRAHHFHQLALISFDSQVAFSWASGAMQLSRETAAPWPLPSKCRESRQFPREIPVSDGEPQRSREVSAST